MTYRNNNKSKDVAIINPNNAKVLNNYIEHDMINENGIYESTNTIPMARYQYVVNVPQEYSAQTKNLSFTTNGDYNVSDYLDIGYNALKSNSIIGINVSQIYNPETIAIGPLLRNGTYNISNYIGSGYNAVKDDSTIEVRVNTEITIDRVWVYYDTYMLNTFTFQSNNASISIPGLNMLVVFTPNYQSNNYCKVVYVQNTSNSSTSYTPDPNSYYKIINHNVSTVNLRNSNNEDVLTFYRGSNTRSTIYLYNTVYNLDFGN